MTELEITRHNALIDPGLHVWGWEIAVYLFLGGVAAGVMILFAVLRRDAAGARSRWDRALIFAAPALLSVGMLALLLDLHNPLNVFRFYTAFRPSSPMSWGAWILVAIYPATLLLGLAGLTHAQVERLAASALIRRLRLGRLALRMHDFARDHEGRARTLNLVLGAPRATLPGLGCLRRSGPDDAHPGEPRAPPGAPQVGDDGDRARDRAARALPARACLLGRSDGSRRCGAVPGRTLHRSVLGPSGRRWTRCATPAGCARALAQPPADAGLAGPRARRRPRVALDPGAGRAVVSSRGTLAQAGKRPILRNIGRDAIEHFRRTVEMVDLVGQDDARTVLTRSASRSCRINPRRSAGASVTSRPRQRGWIPRRPVGP